MIMSSLEQKTADVETYTCFHFKAIFGYDVFEQSVGENIKSETKKLHGCKWNTMEHLQGRVAAGLC